MESHLDDPAKRPADAQSQKRPKVILALVASLGLTLAGLTACSSPEKTPEPKESATSAAPVVEQTPEPEVTLWPLTGHPAGDDPAATSRAALSAKVENSAQARPQSGLEYADLVWEEMIEGGYTRYNAVYHSQIPEEVGPIRSVRPMDVGISGPLQGILIYSGGIKDFENLVTQRGLHGYNEDTSQGALYRVRWRRMPHNLYLSVPAALEKHGKDLQAPQQLWAYPVDGAQPTATAKGTPAAQLQINFPTVYCGWAWNGQRWQRSDMGQVTAARNGTPVQADNVVIMQVQVQPTPYRDPAGATVMETIMSGQGSGWVATDGKLVPIKWSKDADDSPVKLAEEGGAEVTLKPGQTWVELLPVNGGRFAAS